MIRAFFFVILLCGSAFAAGFNVEFSAKPKPLVPFNIIIDYTGDIVRVQEVSFTMKNMYMGELRFTPKFKMGKYIVNNVVLPICKSKEKLWQLEIIYHVESARKSEMIEFETE